MPKKKEGGDQGLLEKKPNGLEGKEKAIAVASAREGAGARGGKKGLIPKEKSRLLALQKCPPLSKRDQRKGPRGNVRATATRGGGRVLPEKNQSVADGGGKPPPPRGKDNYEKGKGGEHLTRKNAPLNILLGKKALSI